MRWQHLSSPQYTLESEHTPWQRRTEIRGRKIHGKSAKAGNRRRPIRQKLDAETGPGDDAPATIRRRCRQDPESPSDAAQSHGNKPASEPAGEDALEETPSGR